MCTVYCSLCHRRSALSAGYLVNITIFRIFQQDPEFPLNWETKFQIIIPFNFFFQSEKLSSRPFTNKLNNQGKRPSRIHFELPVLKI